MPVTEEMIAAMNGARPKVAYMGRDLLCVFDDADTVRNMTVDQDKVRALDGLLLHMTAPGTDVDCVSRSFAPKCNVAEDPVCGSGHCHIVPYWVQMLGKDTLVAYQASRRGGTLYCTQAGDRIRMSGNAVQELKEPVSSADAATKAYVDGKRKQFSAELATAWEGAGPFTQTVAVKGILETDMPHVVPVYGDDSDTAASRQEGWSCVSAGKAVPDGILFTCFDSKPDAEIPIQIEVMR